MAFLWLINGGDPNYLLTGMILQVQGCSNHLGCKKKPVNNGMNYLSTGAGFHPSTVWYDVNILIYPQDL